MFRRRTGSPAFPKSRELCLPGNVCLVYWGRRDWDRDEQYSLFLGSAMVTITRTGVRDIVQAIINKEITPC